MRTKIDHPPKKKSPPKNEKLQPTRLHEKAIKKEKKKGSLFRNTTADLKLITERGIFTDSLKTAAKNITEHAQANLQPGQQLKQELQWILNLNDTVNINKNWNDNPATSNAYTFAYLAIMSGSIEVDNFNPIEILSPQEGQKKVAWEKILSEKTIDPQKILEKSTPKELAEKAQRQLKNEFQIAQLALLPKEDFHLFEISENVQQIINQKIIKKLLKKGIPHEEIWNNLGQAGINKSLLTGLAEGSEKEKLDKYYKTTDQAEFRQLIHQLAAGSILEQDSIQLPEGITNFDDLNLSEIIKKAASEENQAKITESIFANKEKLKALPQDVNIFDYLRTLIHKDLTSADYPDIDILIDLATINPSFLKRIEDKAGESVGLKLLKKNIDLLDEGDINELTEDFHIDIFTTITTGAFDQPRDLAFTFLERKINEAVSLETAPTLSREDLTPEFFKNLKAKDIAPILIGNIFTKDELLDQEGIRKQEVQKTIDQYLYYNQEEDTWEMKIALSQEDYDKQQKSISSLQTYSQKALSKIAEEQYPDTHPAVKAAYLQKARIFAVKIAQSRLDIMAQQEGDPDAIDKKTLDYNFEQLFTQEINKLVDNSGNPITSNIQVYNQLMDVSQQEVAQTHGRVEVKKLQQEMANQATKEFTNLYITEKTAEKIDPTIYVALEKIGKLEPKVLESTKELNKKVEEISKEIQGPLNIPALKNIETSDPDQIPASTWSILFDLVPNLAQSIFNQLSQEKQQQIQGLYS